MAKKKDDKWKDHKMTKEEYLRLDAKSGKLLDKLVKDAKTKTGPHGGLMKKLNKLVKDDEDFF